MEPFNLVKTSMAVGVVLLLQTCGGSSFLTGEDPGDAGGYSRSEYETGVAASRGQWDDEMTWAAAEKTHKAREWDYMATWYAEPDR